MSFRNIEKILKKHGIDNESLLEELCINHMEEPRRRAFKGKKVDPKLFKELAVFNDSKEEDFLITWFFESKKDDAVYFITLGGEANPEDFKMGFSEDVEIIGYTILSYYEILNDLTN